MHFAPFISEIQLKLVSKVLVFLQCIHSVSLLRAPQDHLSWTALAWQGGQKASWLRISGTVHTKLLTVETIWWSEAWGPVQPKHGCSLTTITNWWCYLTRAASTLPNEWSEQVEKLWKSETFLLLQILQHMDVTAVKHAGGKKGGGIESLRDRKKTELLWQCC